VDDHEALISGSVYTDVNGERQDPNARMIDTLREVVSRNRCGTDGNVPSTEDIVDEPVHRRGTMRSISYAIRGQSALMNSWENPHYFTAAFPTLFPNPLPDWNRGASRQEGCAAIAHSFCGVGFESS
jgi:hypothetical protein